MQIVADVSLNGIEPHHLCLGDPVAPLVRMNTEIMDRSGNNPGRSAVNIDRTIGNVDFPLDLFTGHETRPFCCFLVM